MTLRNFTAGILNLELLMGDYQLHQEFTDEALKELNRTRTEFNNAQAYHDLCVDYQALFSKMLKACLDAKTGQEMMKIRLAYAPKVGALLTKMEDLLQKMAGVVPVKALESRKTVDENMSKLDQLIGAAKHLKNMIPAAPQLTMVPDAPQE